MQRPKVIIIDLYPYGKKIQFANQFCMPILFPFSIKITLEFLIRNFFVYPLLLI